MAKAVPRFNAHTIIKPFTKLLIEFKPKNIRFDLTIMMNNQIICHVMGKEYEYLRGENILMPSKWIIQNSTNKNCIWVRCIYVQKKEIDSKDIWWEGGSFLVFFFHFHFDFHCIAWVKHTFPIWAKTLVIDWMFPMFWCICIAKMLSIWSFSKLLLNDTLRHWPTHTTFLSLVCAYIQFCRCYSSCGCCFYPCCCWVCIFSLSYSAVSLVVFSYAFACRKCIDLLYFFSYCWKFISCISLYLYRFVYVQSVSVCGNLSSAR